MGNFYWMSFDTIWNHYDQVLNTWEHTVIKPQLQLANLPNYPHSDCWVDDEGKHLWLRFALAGYDQTGLGVKATKNVLRITAKGDKEEGVKFVHHGISKKDIDFSLNIDEAFNLTKAKTDFINGLLTIQIPRHHKGEHATVDLM